MQLTTKQIELMIVISRGNGVGLPCDLDEIIERVRYETTKPSMQFSIRALIKRRLIIKRGIEDRRGRHRIVIEATVLGHSMVTPTAIAALSFVEDEGCEIIEEFGPSGDQSLDEVIL